MIENGARLDATNSDNELPVDLADGDETATLLTQYMNKLGEIQYHSHVYLPSYSMSQKVVVNRGQSVFRGNAKNTRYLVLVDRLLSLQISFCR